MPRLYSFDQKCSKNCNILKYYYNFNSKYCIIYSYDGKAEFSAAIILVLSVILSFLNLKYADFGTQKTLPVTINTFFYIFIETVIIFSGFFDK